MFNKIEKILLKSIEKVSATDGKIWAAFSPTIPAVTLSPTMEVSNNHPAPTSSFPLYAFPMGKAERLV